MSTFFISQIRPPIWIGDINFKINTEKYCEELKILWPDVQISPESSKEYVLWWELRRGQSYEIMGGLQADYNVVSLEGNERYVAEFAVWHRAFVPREYPLYIFHESLTINFELSSKMSLIEVLGFIT